MRLKHLYRYLYPTQFINRYQNGVMYHETQPYIQILYMIIHPLFATKGFDMLYMLMPAGVIPTPGDGPSLQKNTSKLLEDAIYKTTRTSMKTVDSDDAVEIMMTKNQHQNCPNVRSLAFWHVTYCPIKPSSKSQEGCQGFHRT